MSAQWVGLCVWALVAASAVFWGSRLLVKPSPPPAHATIVSTDASLRGDLARLFGDDARPVPVAAAAVPAVPIDARFKLLGVVAARPPSQGGIALISVDDKPARAYRVGATVEGQTILLAVSARGADLGPRAGAPSVALQLPALPAPATGVMPPAAGHAGAMTVPGPGGPPAAPASSADEPPAGGAPAPGAPGWRPTPVTR